MENECVLQNSTYIYFPCFYGMTPTKSPTHLSHKTSSTVCTREWLLSSLEFQMIFKYIANSLSKCSTVEFVFYNYVKHLWLKMKHIQWNRKHYQQKCIKTMQYVCLYNNVAKLPASISTTQGPYGRKMMKANFFTSCSYLKTWKKWIKLIITKHNT
jgi:hypothetical protein